MTSQRQKYEHYADHPRFGRAPRITGLNPDPLDPDVHLLTGAVSSRELAARFQRATGNKPRHRYLFGFEHRAERIANTAIAADLNRQTPATIPVTHYFDLKRICCDCRRPFIFFAEEQKYWYEELGFSLDSNCKRCVDCRKKCQGIARLRETYETLFHVSDKTPEQSFDMAAACITLIEGGAFTAKQLPRVRGLLNAIPEEDEIRQQPAYRELIDRIAEIAATQHPSDT